MSADATIAVSIEESAIAAILSTCRAAAGRETGGVLVGRYSELLDHAVVLEATPPPSDSIRFPTSFIRGIKGLGALFRKRWQRSEHYVGEWHFHPRATSRPSTQDLKQMREFARAPEQQCPRPILLVLGGDVAGSWELSATAIDALNTVPLIEVVSQARA